MTDLEYIDIFETIARQLKDIAHSESQKQFTSIDIEEVITGLRNKVNLNNWTLTLESFEGKLLGKGDEAFSNNMTGAFMIVRKCQHNDFDQIKETISQATGIAKKIVARLIRDKHLAIQGAKPRYFRGIDASVFEYQKVGPIFDSAYGRRVEFRILENESLIVNVADWDETL